MNKEIIVRLGKEKKEMEETLGLTEPMTADDFIILKALVNEELERERNRLLAKKRTPYIG